MTWDEKADNQSPKRSIRRGHRDRLKKKRKFHWGYYPLPDAVAAAVDTPTPCSCWMCGNERKYFGRRTRQELKAAEAFKLD